jgi:hypothetical protein
VGELFVALKIGVNAESYSSLRMYVDFPRENSMVHAHLLFRASRALTLNAPWPGNTLTPPQLRCVVLHLWPNGHARRANVLKFRSIVPFLEQNSQFCLSYAFAR